MIISLVSGVVGLLKPVKILLHECLAPLIEERCSQVSETAVFKELFSL